MSENLDGTVFYDGYCNLCSGSVNFISARDSGKFEFEPLESEKASIIEKSTESVVLVDRKGQHYESEAVTRILKELRFPWNALGYFLSTFPTVLLNKAYRIIADSRYEVFGKRDKCKVLER